jgi:hypothetical protein
MINIQSNNSSDKLDRISFIRAIQVEWARCEDCKETRLLLVAARGCRLGFCTACGKSLQMLTRDRLTKALRVTSLAIKQWIGGDRTQFFQTVDGKILIVQVSQNDAACVVKSKAASIMPEKRVAGVCRRRFQLSHS